MDKIFVSIFDFFSRNKLVMWIVLSISTILFAFAALKVKYVEDINTFFPDDKDFSLIYDCLSVKDRFVVMFSSNSQDPQEEDLDRMIEAAKQFSVLVGSDEKFSDDAVLSVQVNDTLIGKYTSFIYDNLPIFLDDSDFDRLDTLLNDKNIELKMGQNYNALISPIGNYISDFIYKDPLSIGTSNLQKLQSLGNNFNYEIIDNYIFSKDRGTLLCTIQPTHLLSNKENRHIIDVIESSLKVVNKGDLSVNGEYFGIPAIAEYNAKQIKKDSLFTLNVAIIIVLIFITLAFRNRYSVFLVITPVIYGALFSLAFIYLFVGEISLIAVGSGSVIFGIALSYSLHVLSHTNHSTDIRQLIKELSYPLTVGSFTTIGAFAGLLFTNSKLLQDFGLFSSLTLVGTTLFSLIFLPHFLTVTKGTEKRGKLLMFVEKLSDLHLDTYRPLVWAIIVISVVLGTLFGKVGFDSDMMKLNYDEPNLKMAEDRLNSFTKGDSLKSSVMFIAYSENIDEAIVNYSNLCRSLDSLEDKGWIESYSAVNDFLISDSLQSYRLERWNTLIDKYGGEQIYKKIDQIGLKLGFDEGAFSDFEKVINKKYTKLLYNSDGQYSDLLNNWVSGTNSMNALIAQVNLSESDKNYLYSTINSQNGVIIADKAFFAGKMVEDVSNDFYFILYISGILIFIALMFSYGRIELTLISFLPMFLSWLIIIGVMNILGIDFNIVTIILSTFIFGIGDDFSIFIMDGLLKEYKDRSKVLAHHKTAIFFSSFAIIVGMGALIFAKHPAMHSLGQISLLGIIVVVFVAFIVPPYIFRVLITSQTSKGGFPFTILSLFYTIYAFSLFLLGCYIIQFAILLSFLLPISMKRRKSIIHSFTSWSCRSFLKMMLLNKEIYINETGETFETPAVVIVNHQSYIDTLKLLVLNKKFIMVTNSWVWNSPVLGRIVRFLDFYYVGEGFDVIPQSLIDKVNDGYSVVVFPEGTRSPSCNIQRFHKGAFFLAERLKLDIVPIILYGPGLVSSKKQPFYIKKGLIVSKILGRIPYGSDKYGTTYQEKTKSISAFFKKEYISLYDQFNRTSNPFCRDAIIKNYIYKGPVLEWYMRVKMKLEGWYDRYDRVLPRDGFIVDLGCGYGAMSYMLYILSNRRRIVGVDYDQEKIAVANNCFSKCEDIEFLYGDIRTFQIPFADGFIISDVLHYIDQDSQIAVIERCINHLNRDGVVVIRDGDTSIVNKHSVTERTEKWSTKIIKFNKTDGPLCFLSRGMIYSIAQKNSMSVDVIEGTTTSNTLFILKHINV